MIEELTRRVYDRCHLVGEFRLRSGQISAEYFDKYLFESDPALLVEVAEAMVELLPACDVLAGLEMGGIPIATLMSQLTGLPVVFVRKQAKEHGTSKVIEGPPVAGLRAVAVEDAVTTAGAIVAACEELRVAGATIEVAVCALDRGEAGVPNLRAVGVELRSVMNKAALDAAGEQLAG